MAEAVTRELRACAAAFAFLTRIPLAKRTLFDTGDLAGSVVYFPLVGAAVGGFAAIVLFLAIQVWSGLVAVVLSFGATVILTGAFHEDALADSFDGFGGGWTRDQVLSIMRDSRVGSYALVGVTLVLLTKVAALNDIVARQSSGVAAVTLITAHVLGRWSSVVLMRLHPYVRASETQPGTGSPFADGPSAKRLAVATVIAIGVAVGALSYIGGIAVALALVMALLAGRYFVHRIGGYTGDALGAANQLIELAVYLLVAAIT